MEIKLNTASAETRRDFLANTLMSVSTLPLLSCLGGCTKRNLELEVQQDPNRAGFTSIHEVLELPERYLNRSIIVAATPHVISEQPRLRFDGGDTSHLYFLPHAQYTLTEDHGVVLPMRDDRQINIEGLEFLDAAQVAQHYRLLDKPSLVAGRLRMRDAGTIYLELELAQPR